MKPEEKPSIELDMRHSKLKPEEAALLAGELSKPSWQSKNEGIHERVSFEDSIWGFDLAGGSFYKTPLRVVGVKPDSRAEKAGIRPGDKLKRINDIDTSTLTIQEAHEIIIESGIYLRIAVTAPEDEEDAYFCYEDPTEKGYDSDEERRKEEEKARKRQVHAKVSSYWSLQWPWVSKRKIIYRESNCFKVPSKYESKHIDKFSPQPEIRTESDIVLDSSQSIKAISDARSEAKNAKDLLASGNDDDISNKTNGITTNGNESDKKPTDVNIEINNKTTSNGLKDNNGLMEIPEIEEELENSQSDSIVPESIDEVSSLSDDSQKQNDLHNEIALQNGDIADSHDDKVINEVLDINDDELSRGEEEEILNSVLSESEEISVDAAESIDNER